ncbi:hypothetical protein [Calidithermus timidus]|jgi:hypothetical protein|uniref:hypothetical protein n=1 Tax=Calidithermus timidus TaxID=307124 RepID=UPI00037A3D56|nr:hypothetical protein [Calidithermus timidus]
MEAGLVELLDLFEYKVADLLEGRNPKGGRSSVVRLRQQLLQSNLPPTLARRFRQIDAEYRSLRGQPEEHLPAIEADLGGIVVEDEPSLDTPERAVLEQLAEAVYWQRTAREITRQMRHFNIGKREALRLTYAVLQNLESYAATPYFKQDYNLSHLEIVHPIPAYSDPLVRLEDTEVGRNLILELVREAHTLSERLQLPSEETLPYLRRFLRRVIDKGLALRYGGGKGISQEVLRRSLEEARRHNLTSTQIRQLEQRLREQSLEDRRLAMVMEQDRQAFSAAAEKLLELLQKLLPYPKGEAQPPTLPAQIWLGLDPKLSLQQIPNDLPGLTLRLVPGSFKAWDAEFTVTQTGGEFSLVVNGSEYPLSEVEPLAVPWGSFELWAIRRGQYAHLRLETRGEALLSSLLAEGRVLAYLLRPDKAFAYLRLLRAFSARLKGPITYHDFTPDKATRYQEASPEALQDFARKGLEVVRSRMERSSDWPALMREVGLGLALEKEAERMVQELTSWLSQRPNNQTQTHSLGSTTLGDGPSSLKVGSLVLSLRQEGEAVYVSAPGVMARRLSDLLVWHLPEGSAVLAREGPCIAHTFVAFDSHV